FLIVCIFSFCVNPFGLKLKLKLKSLSKRFKFKKLLSLLLLRELLLFAVISIESFSTIGNLRESIELLLGLIRVLFIVFEFENKFGKLCKVVFCIVPLLGAKSIGLLLLLSLLILVLDISV